MMTSKMIQTRALETSERMSVESIFSTTLGWMQQIPDWWQKRRACLRLMAMDDYLLKDIGVGRSEIYGAVNLTPEPAPAGKTHKRP